MSKLSLQNKKILVGVTGGIAVYKSCSLVNLLISEGAEVRVIMTKAAKQFVTPLTFQALTNHPVYEDLWDIIDPHSVEHISLARWADVIVVAPATANTIAKIAHGMADNLLTTVILAVSPETHVFIAPAMNTHMWENNFVQNNIASIMGAKGFYVIDPREGILACREEGAGKIARPEDIVDMIKEHI